MKTEKWEIDEFLTIHANGRTVCSIPFENQQAGADARKILAANEMESALRSVEFDFKHHGEISLQTNKEVRRVLAKIDAKLLKIT